MENQIESGQKSGKSHGKKFLKICRNPDLLVQSQ